jgi:hypothetical protein
VSIEAGRENTERETETETETERERDRETERQKERQRETERASIEAEREIRRVSEQNLILNNRRELEKLQLQRNRPRAVGKEMQRGIYPAVVHEVSGVVVRFVQ